MQRRQASAQAPSERVRRVEDQRRVERDMRAALDDRQHCVRGQAGDRWFDSRVGAAEHAADHAFLMPKGARCERAVGRQAGQLGAGAGAAR